MPYLMDLDDNLLYEIFSELLYYRPTLYNLSLVSRRCNELVRPILYRHMSINILPSFRPRHHLPDLILRTLQNRPEFSLLVRSVLVHSLDYSESTQQTIDAIIQMLKNVRYLKLWIARKETPLSPVILEGGLLSHLSELHTGITRINISEIFDFLTLPSARTLTVQKLSLPVTVEDLEQLRNLRSPITELSLCAGQKYGFPPFHLRLSTIDGLLRCTSRLQKISFMIPTSHDAYEGPSVDLSSYRLMCELSPVKLSQALHSIASTLTELDIKSRSETWDRHDGSKLNLKDFVALKRVSIPSRLVFPSPVPLTVDDGQSRAGLYKLLPSTLENMRINFEANSAFISLKWPTQWTEQTTQGVHPGIRPWMYRWCMELAEMKAVSFPKLSSFVVEEESWRENHSTTLLQLPLEMSRTFEVNHINISVLCRGRNRYGKRDENRGPEIHLYADDSHEG
ncbi:hypothetical protein PVAG01_06867 [Phlyctema vagabunda]|uniref:F-box domain-containing protein n=1 Tax=Phlyctema vagabunda TaxID=108571 RepID=A0ABR4PH98_9HELO